MAVEWDCNGCDFHTAFQYNHASSRNRFQPVVISTHYRLFLKFLRKWWLTKNLKTTNTLQSEANKIYEGISFELAQRYANHGKTLLIFLFFQPILPFSSITAFLAFVTAYFADRFVLLRMSLIPNTISAELTYSMYRLFDIILLVYPVTSPYPVRLPLLRILAASRNQLLLCHRLLRCVGKPSFGSELQHSAHSKDRPKGARVSEHLRRSQGYFSLRIRQNEPSDSRQSHQRLPLIPAE